MGEEQQTAEGKSVNTEDERDKLQVQKMGCQNEEFGKSSEGIDEPSRKDDEHDSER
jgi:hypothetical protein